MCTFKTFAIDRRLLSTVAFSFPFHLLLNSNVALSSHYFVQTSSIVWPLPKTYQISVTLEIRYLLKFFLTFRGRVELSVQKQTIPVIFYASRIKACFPGLWCWENTLCIALRGSAGSCVKSDVMIQQWFENDMNVRLDGRKPPKPLSKSVSGTKQRLPSIVNPTANWICWEKKYKCKYTNYKLSLPCHKQVKQKQSSSSTQLIFTSCFSKFNTKAPFND